MLGPQELDRRTRLIPAVHQRQQRQVRAWRREAPIGCELDDVLGVLTREASGVEDAACGHVRWYRLVGDHRGVQGRGVLRQQVLRGALSVVVKIEVVPRLVELGLALEAHGFGGEDHGTRLSIGEGEIVVGHACHGAAPAERIDRLRVICYTRVAELEHFEGDATSSSTRSPSRARRAHGWASDHVSPIPATSPDVGLWHE